MVFRQVFHHLLNYFLSADTILSHVIGGGLLFALIGQGVHKKYAALLSAVEGVISYLVWLVLPESGFDAIVSIWIFLIIYEKIIGPRFTIQEGVIFRSVDLYIEKYLKSSCEINLEVVQTDEYLEIKSDLQFSTFQRNIWLQQINTTDKICLDDVASVEDGCNVGISKRFRSRGIESQRCITMQGYEKDSPETVLLAKNDKERDAWLEILNQILGTKIVDVRLAWLDKLLMTLLEESVVIHLSVGFDEALHFLDKSGRAINRKYGHLLFKKFTPNDLKSKFFECNLKKESFRAFFLYVVHRPAITEVYERWVNQSRGKAKLNSKQFHKFVVYEQKEDVSESTTKEWIKKHEPVFHCLNMSSVGFTNYILSEEHSIFRRECREVYQDMDQPLSHYFIATSHNTYLTKDQLKSKSTVEAYITALKRGCKCVELDIWDGTNNEPVIYHGYTLTSKILVKDVIYAIKEHAFCVSRYPLILSFENHCSVEQQKIVAQYLRDILADLIYSDPLPFDEKCLPSPASLKGHIIVKSKKLKTEFDFDTFPYDDTIEDDDIFSEEFQPTINEDLNFNDDTKSDAVSLKSENDDDEFTSIEAIKERRRKALTSLEESLESIRRTIKNKEKSKPERIAKELSDLVVYCQPLGFKGFEHAKQNSRYYEMISFSERRAFKLAKEDPCDFLQYNSCQLSRIYPAGSRIDSSNYDPVSMWNVGCQLVALNYQTACPEMQLNQALFQDNGGCGYVLKPEFMRQETITFDPRKPDDSQLQTLKIRIISGHEIPYKNEKILKCERQLFVQIRIVGVEADCQSLKTKMVKNNGFNPVWNEELTFKIHVPDQAIISFTILTKEVYSGHYSIPLRCMQRGYRRVPISNKFSEQDLFSYIFVHIETSAANEKDTSK